MTRATARPAGSLVLDGEALAKLVRRDRELTGWLALARADDLRVVTCASTLVEVIHPRINRAALDWTLSRLVIEPVTEHLARVAADLLAGNGLHGHRHALDALVAAVALSSPTPVSVLTSDPQDLGRLCGSGAAVITV